MAEAGAKEVVAVDVAADALGAAFGIPSVRPVEADVTDLPLESDSFDAAVCFEVLEHLADPSAALDEIRRVLKPDGFMMVSSPNRSVHAPGNPHHRHEFSPGELKHALEARFANVRLFRQQDWVTSAILDDDNFRAGGDSVLEVTVRKIVDGMLDREMYTLAIASDTNPPLPPHQAVLTEAIDLRHLLDDREAVKRTVVEQDEHLDALRYRIARMSERQQELRRLLVEAHEQLLRRDEELLESFRREVEPRDEEIVWLREVAGDYERKLEGMESSRLWQLAGRYYRARDALKARRRGIGR
jgi:SAM-dependent methyltransferase